MRTIPIPPARAARPRRLLALVTLVPLLAGCGADFTGATPPGVVAVVAAENTWGSLATQLGGAHAEVTSLVSNPNTDPHAYEPTAADARAVAEAQYLLVNGAGYDPWAQRLADADPAEGRITLSVADLAGRRQGDNPHMWYSPAIVLRVVQRISADLARLDPADAVYFAQRASDFTAHALARYAALREAIRTRYQGTPVGATESIVVDLARDLGLDLLTPAGYMRAISEGNEPSTQDKATADAQVAQRRIRVLVYNSQNSTPDIQALLGAARARGIPVVAVTETLAPASATFQDWQVRQLEALQRALAAATGTAP